MTITHHTGASLLDCERYLPDPAWFQHNPTGIHGVGHVTRVIVWSAVLADRIGRTLALRFEELLWAAATHDVGRHDDGVDRGHGGRSGAWVLDSLRASRPAILPTVDIDFIAELCAWHEIPDAEIGRLSLELLILKDADGLDRVRLGDLDPDRLRFQHARRLVPLAENLLHHTGYEPDDGEVVLEQAYRLFSSGSD